MPNPASKFERLGATAILVVIAAIFVALERMSRQFDEVFSGFGADLPLLTSVLMYEYVYYIVPAVATLSYIAYWLNVRYAVSAQVVCLLISLAAIPLVTIGMYLPIFQLGATVE